jgi:hypothetical protein
MSVIREVAITSDLGRCRWASFGFLRYVHVEYGAARIWAWILLKIFKFAAMAYR